jgi:hypothetical protein
MPIKFNEPARLEHLALFNGWPRRETQKVPSAISYSPTSRRRRQWGHDIDDDSAVMRWTKLELEPRDKNSELERLRDTVRGLNLMNTFRQDQNAAVNNEVPRHLGKAPEDILRDFIRKVARQWYEYMQTDAQSVLGSVALSNVPLDIVVTHPTVSRLAVKSVCRISRHRTLTKRKNRFGHTKRETRP